MTSFARTASIFVLSLLMGALTSVSALAQTAGPPWPADVAVPSSHRVKFTSEINGVSYTLFVRVPLTPAPPEGHPVLYVLDGDFLFGAAGDMALTVGDPARWPIVVGIGHGLFDDMDVVSQYAPRPPGDESPIGLQHIGMANAVLRNQDYTLPVAPEHRAPAWTGLTPENVGGVDAFLRVIEEEIKPRVAAIAPVNADNQALFGHSIAGLAVLRALFTEPDAFRTFIAASPSIWWDADAVLADEAAFGARVAAGEVAPRVLLTVGADEPDSPNPPQAFIDTLPEAQRTELTTYVQMASQWSGMVSGSRSLSERLAALDGGAYKVQFVAFEGENHGTVQPAALMRGMRFAFLEP